MAIDFGTALSVAALAASVTLVLDREDRLFPVVALIASTIQALIVLGIISLSSERFRIDVILPAVLVLAGIFCWARSAKKPSITAGTVLLAVASIELLFALRILR